jgi:hypothetical protein
LNANDPAEAGVTELEAGTELPEATFDVEVEVGVPVHAPLLKKA